MSDTARLVVDQLLEADADQFDPRSYLQGVKPQLELVKEFFVKQAVETGANALDTRGLVSLCLQKLGVDRRVADTIGLEQGSSQAFVNAAYIRQFKLPKSVFRDAVAFIAFVYKLEQEDGLFDRLYDQYTAGE